jgi:hypothetical protein
MRHFLATALAAATLSLSGFAASAAPLSTSDLLKPQSIATQTWAKCHRVCHAWGYCGYGHHRHRCCKYWKRVCH